MDNILLIRNVIFISGIIETTVSYRLSAELDGTGGNCGQSEIRRNRSNINTKMLLTCFVII